MKAIKKIILIFSGLILFIVILAAVGILWLSANEYKPPLRETVTVTPSLSEKPSRLKPIEMYIWNIGYACLDATQDFFMDGGKGVRPASASTVEDNIRAVMDFIAEENPNIFLLQEVDVNSKRSYGINQVKQISGCWKGSSAFAYNFNVPFVPIPFPEFIGKVESGLLSLNTFGSAAERISLPTSFKWPARAAQLKRCLLVERIPVQDSAELVLINLHLDAYDSDGSGRIAQTKALAELMISEYEKGNYCIAAGDFNQVFPAFADVYPVEENPFFTAGILDTSLFPEDWIFAADPSAPSARSNDRPYDGNREGFLFYIIDGFILSPNIELVSVQTMDLDFKNSDHNPVKLVFVLK